LAGYSAHGGWSVPRVSDVRWSFCPTSSSWTNPTAVNHATRGVFAPAFRKEEVTTRGTFFTASFCRLVVTRGGVAPAPASGRVRHQIALPSGSGRIYGYAFVYMPFVLMYRKYKYCNCKIRDGRSTTKKKTQTQTQHRCTKKLTYINESIPILVTLHP
jgi:hypothetical protein